MSISPSISGGLKLEELKDRPLAEVPIDALFGIPPLAAPASEAVHVPFGPISIDALISLKQSGDVETAPRGEFAPPIEPLACGETPRALAKSECEVGIIPPQQLVRTVIHREGDRVEADIEPQFIPPQMHLSDLWFNADFADWVAPALSPTGFLRKKPAGSAVSEAVHPLRSPKRVPKGSMNMLGLLALLYKLFKPLAKRYVIGLRGELLEEDDEQLLGNPDVMLLPYSPPELPDIPEPPAQKRDPKRGNRWWRRQRDKRSPDDREPNEGEIANSAPFDYQNFDVFGFFDQLLAKHAPGSTDHNQPLNP